MADGGVCVCLLWPLLLLLATAPETRGHGRLMDPPARNSMWRLGFNNPVNYNDNELYCGGRMVQWLRNGGKCGVCGDAWHGNREHEAGGKYANGIITRSYHQGDVMPVTVHLTANHQGWFEFRICPVNDAKTRVTQECLDKHVLERADGGGVQFPVPKGKYNAFFNYSLLLPPDLTCKQCVVQWKYRTGNTWDKDDNSGVFCLGCGPQEEFYNCADIEILRGPRPKDKPMPELKFNQEIEDRAVEKDKKKKEKEKNGKTGRETKTIVHGDRQMEQHADKDSINHVLKDTQKKPLWDPKHDGKDHVGNKVKDMEKHGRDPKHEDTKTKPVWDMRRDDRDVKGHLTNTAERPKEEKYSWHAASPISWAVLASRIATPNPTSTFQVKMGLGEAIGKTTPTTRPPNTTPRRSIFTPHPTATKRQSSFARHMATARPVYSWVAATRTTPATTSPTTTTPLPTTATKRSKADSFARQSSNRARSENNSASSHQDREQSDSKQSEKDSPGKVPGWLVRVAEQMSKKTTPQGAKRTRLHTKQEDDIFTRRQRFRQRLWRHLQARSKHRRQHDVTNTVFYNSDQGGTGTTAIQSETTKPTPVCVTENKQEQQQDQRAVGQDVVITSKTDRPPAQLYQQQPLAVRPLVLPHQPSARWWHGYNRVVWSAPRALGRGGQLQCRATVRLSGGMDDWCTANCNANYCPASMCVCQDRSDAWPPAYDVYHPHSPAAWLPRRPLPRRLRTAYRAVTPLRPRRADTQRRAEAQSKSIFSPPVQYQNQNNAHTEDLRATYPPLAHRKDARHLQGGGGGGEERGRAYLVSGGWERKRLRCRAVGRYTGLAEYDEWCTNNCSKAMCPLFLCQCDTF